MAYKIKDILLEDENSVNYKIVNNDKDDKLSDISKINIFIGENNSGKSRFLRELFKTDFRFIPANLNIDRCNKIRKPVEHNYSKLIESFKDIE